MRAPVGKEEIREESKLLAKDPPGVVEVSRSS